MNVTPLLACVLTALPIAARAQGVMYLIPSVSVAAASDSNVFFSSTAPESDVVLRTSPAIRGGYRSSQVLFTGGYTFDAEQYRDHPELNDPLARQLADMNLRYTPGRIATFTTSASYLTTHMPQEFSVQTGLNIQRAPAEQYSVAPALNLQFSQAWRGSMQFEYTRSAFTDAIPAGSTIAQSIATRTLTFGLDRRVSSTDTALAQYREEEFEFGGAPLAASDAGTARAVLAGWSHAFSTLTRARVMAGPRFADGAVRPEISAEVRRRLESGDVAVTFARTEAVALGEAGTIEVDRLAATGTLRPSRHLELRAGPSVSRDLAHASGLDVTVYLVDVAATSPLTRWLSIEASYQGAWERGDMPQSGSLDFARRVFTVRVITTAPSREGTPSGPTGAGK